jgi:hypothetical protein
MTMVAEESGMALVHDTYRRKSGVSNPTVGGNRL